MTDIQEEKVDEIKRSLDRVYFYTDTVDCVAITGSKNGVLITYHIYIVTVGLRKDRGIKYEHKYNKTLS